MLRKVGMRIKNRRMIKAVIGVCPQGLENRFLNNRPSSNYLQAMVASVDTGCLMTPAFSKSMNKIRTPNPEMSASQSG